MDARPDNMRNLAVAGRFVRWSVAETSATSMFCTDERVSILCRTWPDLPEITTCAAGR